MNKAPFAKAIYLAGGFKSGWQDKVISVNSRFTYIDPREHNLKYNREYTFWDLAGIDSCDWVLGYMEADNPSGYGLALEIGYAKGIGKRIILVDEKSPVDAKFDNYFGMCRACADLTFSNLDYLLGYLAKFP